MTVEPGSSAFESASTSTALASAAPVRVSGTRARAGNAMGRTRAGILEATGRAIEKYGVRRATMGDVASVAGIAKGTLYNHFRTKGDLLTAAVCAGIDGLADDCVALARGNGADGLARALQQAAETLSAHPALVRVAADEPTELVRLLLPGVDGGWPVARAAISRVLLAAEPALAASPAFSVLIPEGRTSNDTPAPGEGPAGETVPVPAAVAAAETTPTADPAAADTAAADTAAADVAPVAAEVAPVADTAAVETVLRWLVTFTGAPGVPGETAAGAALLASALVR